MLEHTVYSVILGVNGVTNLRVQGIFGTFDVLPSAVPQCKM